jgi:hypothetical protein
VLALPDGGFLAVLADRVARFRPDGALDPSYGAGGFARLPEGMTASHAALRTSSLKHPTRNELALVHEGAIAVAGTVGDDLAIAVLDPRGAARWGPPRAPPPPAPAAPADATCGASPVPIAAWIRGLARPAPGAPTPAATVAAARAALSAGDPLAALEAASAGLAAHPEDATLELLGAALLERASPDRAALLRATAAAPQGPLPTLPPEAPAGASGDAWVNVASAAVRASPSERARRVGALRIGTRVRVLEVAGAFARVEAPPGGGEARAPSGFVARDLLSARAPALPDLLAAAERVAASAPEAELTLLWRALALAPARADVLDRLLAASFAARRYDVAVEAVDAAMRAGRWRADAPAQFAAPGALRLHLLRAAVAKDAAALVPLLGALERVVHHDFDGPEHVPLDAWYGNDLADPAAALWPALRDLLLSSPLRAPDAWTFARGPSSLSIARDGAAWRLVAFDLPGGRGPEDAAGE